MTTRNERTTHRAAEAARLIVLMLLCMLGGLALVHYLTPCEIGLCLLPAAAPTPESSPGNPGRNGAYSYWLRAWHAGYAAARRDYRQGWRTGAGKGLLAGVLLGALGMVAAVQLGRLVG